MLPESAIDLVVICTGPRHARALGFVMAKRKRASFGLFNGFFGKLATDLSVAVAVSGNSEGAAHACLRQMAYLFGQVPVVGFGAAISLAENTHAGDVVLIHSTRRCFCPAAITEEMFSSDSWVFPSERVRKNVLESPFQPDGSLIVSASEHLCANPPHLSLQSKFPGFRFGSMPAEDLPRRGREYLKQRFEIEMVDATSYGLISAANAAGVASLLISIVEEAPGESLVALRRRDRARFEKAAAQAVAAAAARIPSLTELLPQEDCAGISIPRPEASKHAP